MNEEKNVAQDPSSMNSCSVAFHIRSNTNTSMYYTVRCSQCSHISLDVGFHWAHVFLLSYSISNENISYIVHRMGICALQFKRYKSRLFIEFGLVQIQTFHRTNVYFHSFVSNCLLLAHSRYEFSFSRKSQQ